MFLLLLLLFKPKDIRGGTGLCSLGLGQCQTAGWCRPHPLCRSPGRGCRGQTSLKCCAASQAGGAPLGMVWSDSWPRPCPPRRALTLNLEDPSGRSDNFMCVVAWWLCGVGRTKVHFSPLRTSRQHWDAAAPPRWSHCSCWWCCLERSL